MDFRSLLKAAREAAKPKSTRQDAIISDILRDHISAIHFTSQQLAARLEQELTAECLELKDFLATIPKVGAVDPEAEDKIVSVGEKLSARYLTALLEDQGLEAQLVDLSAVIDFEVPEKKLSQEFYRNLAGAIGDKVRLCGDKIPILTGFFGRVPGGLLASCGRGYSDLCAALVAVGSSAKELQVWKEVSGVYTAYVDLVDTGSAALRCY